MDRSSQPLSNIDLLRLVDPYNPGKHWQTRARVPHSLLDIWVDARQLCQSDDGCRFYDPRNPHNPEIVAPSWWKWRLERPLPGWVDAKVLMFMIRNDLTSRSTSSRGKGTPALFKRLFTEELCFPDLDHPSTELLAIPGVVGFVIWLQIKIYRRVMNMAVELRKMGFLQSLPSAAGRNWWDPRLLELCQSPAFKFNGKIEISGKLQSKETYEFQWAEAWKKTRDQQRPTSREAYIPIRGIDPSPESSLSCRSMQMQSTSTTPPIPDIPSAEKAGQKAKDCPRNLRPNSSHAESVSESPDQPYQNTRRRTRGSKKCSQQASRRSDEVEGSNTPSKGIGRISKQARTQRRLQNHYQGGFGVFRRRRQITKYG